MNAPRALTIGLFTDDFFGGVVRAVEVQAAELAKQGHRVVIFAPWLPFERVPDGCEFQPVKFLWHKKLADYMGFLSWSNQTVKKIIAAYDFDIIHSHNERGSMFLCAKIAKTTGVAHVHTFHSNYAGTHAGSPFVSALNSIIYLRAAPFLLGCLSKKQKSVRVHLPQKGIVAERSIYARQDWQAIAKMARHFSAYTSPAPFLVDIVNECTDGALRQQGYFIANGINPVFTQAHRQREPHAPIRFMNCGRLDPEKRVDIALRAFAALGDPAAELHIIGDGSQTAALKSLAKSLGIERQVTFLGQLDNRKQIAMHYANADIFLFPSYHFETQGLVLGEAACAGEAIIYCDERLKVGVNEQNSILVAPNTEAFTAAMQTLLNNRNRLHKMQQASLALCPTLSPKTMAQKMLHVYSKLLGYHTNKN